MRFQNWDVLIFPEESKIPIQEFKTTCHVIQDLEHGLQQQSRPVPVVTAFIPSLQAGAAFRVSIHSWQEPEMSDPMQRCNMFRARLYVDGRVVGVQFFGRDGPWPSIIECCAEITNHPVPEKLTFPTFHRELLSQNFWNAGDDLGRIKLVISQGFSGDGLAFDCFRNIVSFSFQHAPLSVLEASSIAWPNPAMFRKLPLSPHQASGGHIWPQGSIDQKVLAPAAQYDPFIETSR